MKSLLSPRELAEAIGVSESSLKRWADDGMVKVSRTAGGHRRIPVAEAIRFIRETQATLVRPDLLGLAELKPGGTAARQADNAAERLYRYLHDGRAAEARGLVLAEYLAGQAVAEICDGPLRSAMERLGQLWRHGEAGILIEHRATDICLQALNQLRLSIEPPADAPHAVGAAGPEDPYILPALMAAATLTDAGFHATNLGPDTPTPVLAAAARQHRAALVWLSFSTPGDPARRGADIRALLDATEPRGTQIVVGGRFSRETPLPAHPNVRILTSMTMLAEFGDVVRRRRAGARDA